MASTALVRPRRGRLLAGVCAGLARRFGMSPTGVRVLFVLSMLLPGSQILLYIALWIISRRNPERAVPVLVDGDQAPLADLL